MNNFGNLKIKCSIESNCLMESKTIMLSTNSISYSYYFSSDNHETNKLKNICPIQYVLCHCCYNFNNIITYSCYMLPGLDQIIQQIQTLDNFKKMFILCPIYFYKISDIQFAVTGKVKSNETFEDCVQREISEEIGLFIKKKLLIHISTNENSSNSSNENSSNENSSNSSNKHSTKKIVKNYLYLCNSKNIRSYDHKYNKNIVKNSREDKNYKIQVVICGFYDVLNDVIMRIKERPYSYDCNYIKGIMMFPVSEFAKI